MWVFITLLILILSFLWSRLAPLSPSCFVGSRIMFHFSANVSAMSNSKPNSLLSFPRYSLTLLPCDKPYPYYWLAYSFNLESLKMSQVFRYGVKANFEPYCVMLTFFLMSLPKKKNVYFRPRLLEPTQISKPQTLRHKIKTKFESNGEFCPRLFIMSLNTCSVYTL